MKVTRLSCFAAVLALFAFDAFAHVGMFPRQGKAGERHQFFTVRAPVEKEIPNVELKIEIPPDWKAAGGKVDRVLLDPLWKVNVEKDQDDWIKSITWSGAEAPEWAFIQFGMIITLPKLTGLQQIKAYQKYSDGSVVSWIEDATKEGVEKPAARLVLNEGGQGEEGGPQRAAAGGGVLYPGISGLVGVLLGAGLMSVLRRNNK